MIGARFLFDYHYLLVFFSFLLLVNLSACLCSEIGSLFGWVMFTNPLGACRRTEFYLLYNRYLWFVIYGLSSIPQPATDVVHVSMISEDALRRVSLESNFNLHSDSLFHYISSVLSSLGMSFFS